MLPSLLLRSASASPAVDLTNKTAPSTSSVEATNGSNTATSQAPPDKTIADYIKENNITETPVRRGDPGSPTINLPVPPGWQDASSGAPEDAYGAMVFSDPATAADPPTIIVFVAKLAGRRRGKILEYAPAEIQKLPGYEGPQVGGPTKLAGSMRPRSAAPIPRTVSSAPSVR